MPVLYLHIFSIFFILVYAVEKGALISKQQVYQYYVLNCDAKEVFRIIHGCKFCWCNEICLCVAGILKTALCYFKWSEKLLRTCKRCWDLTLYCKLLRELFEWRYSIIFNNFKIFKFWTRITTKRFKLVKQNLKGSHLNYWSTSYQRLHFLQILQSNWITIFKVQYKMDNDAKSSDIACDVTF